MPLWFRLTAATGILVLWGISVTFDMVSDAYTTPTPIHGIVAVAVAFIFGREVGQAVRNRIGAANGPDK